MRVSDLRELNKTVAITRRRKAERSAVNLQREKRHVQTRAMERKAAAAENVIRTRMRHSFARVVFCGLGACAVVGLMVPSFWCLYLIWVAPGPLCSLDPIVEVESGSADATRVDFVCREFLAQYRRAGGEGVRGYFSGLPPFVVDSAISNMETLSQNDFFQMTSIRRDQRIPAYQVRYVSDDKKTVLSLNVVLDAEGHVKITGVCRG